MNELDEVITTFSDVLERPVIIAGGAVRDHLRNEKPKDFDVFMLGQTWQDWEAYKVEFADKFTERLAKFPKVESKIEWHQSEPFLLETILFDGKDFTFRQEDLDGIKVGEYLRLNKCTFPFSSLRRGYRFSERFTMRIHRDDINTICKQILDLKIKDEALPVSSRDKQPRDLGKNQNQ